MIVIGLTGSIGMGKSTTARLFAQEGAWVFDADQAVHDLYGIEGAAVAPIVSRFGPDVIAADGSIDRGALGQILREDAKGFSDLEAVVHPLVGAMRRDFLTKARGAGIEFVVADVPLLLENGGERDVDVVVVVSASADVQRERVLARPGMTDVMLEAILAKQMPDADKRAKADFIVDTGQGIEDARAQVLEILARLRAGEGQNHEPD